MPNGVTFFFEENFWEFKHVQIYTILRKSSLTFTYHSIGPSPYPTFFFTTKLLETVYSFFVLFISWSSTHDNLLLILPTTKLFLVGSVVTFRLLNLMDNTSYLPQLTTPIFFQKNYFLVFCDPMVSWLFYYFSGSSFQSPPVAFPPLGTQSINQRDMLNHLESKQYSLTHISEPV